MIGLLMEAFAFICGEQVPKGSKSGAWAGAIIGFLAGAACALLMVHVDSIDHAATVERYLAFIVPMTGGGALFGSIKGPRKSYALAPKGVRLTQFRESAHTLARITLPLMGFAILLFDLISQKKDPAASENVVWEIVLPLICIAIFVHAARAVWSMQLDSRIYVRRLLDRKIYTIHDIQTWGFESGRGQLVQRAFKGKTDLYIKFQDGFKVIMKVRGNESRAIVNILNASSQRTAS